MNESQLNGLNKDVSASNANGAGDQACFTREEAANASKVVENDEAQDRSMLVAAHKQVESNMASTGASGNPEDIQQLIDKAISETQRLETEARANAELVIALWKDKPLPSDFELSVRKGPNESSIEKEIKGNIKRMGIHLKEGGAPPLEEVLQDTDLINGRLLIDLADGNGAIPDRIWGNYMQHSNVNTM